jgi:uncharacterized protein YndB with AHSA1/START domain
MDMASELKFEQTVNAPASQVYRAFTRATALREWFCDAALADARLRGRVYFWWNSDYYACGEFTALTPDESLAFTWHGRNEPATTQVQVLLEAEGEATRVTVTHAGAGSDKAWAETVKQFERGWEVGLENLKSVLETGQDLRYIRRPMLGITISEFNAEIAAKLGVPVTEGIRLEDVVEGMGAQAAGLQQDDVIVGIGGAEVTGWPTLSRALQAHRAGDNVEVVFYRGSEKKSVTMELSRRPLPEVPATPEALAEAVRQVYAELDAELTQFFDGVSEAEASYRPAPDEWSAKETLAHLVVGERELHAWLADLLNDDERWSDHFENPTNVLARLKATLAAFPALPALLEELKRHETETIAMLAALPPEFVAHKGSYLRLGYNLLEIPGYHTRTHLEQMRAAVAAARSASQ